MTITQVNNSSISHSPINVPSIVNQPNDILRSICSRLKTSDVVHLALTNRHLCMRIFADAPLWRSFLYKHFPDSYVNLKSEAKSLSFYKRLTTAEHNIKAGKHHLQTLHRHQNSVSCMTVYDGLLISGSYGDGTIKVWDLTTRKEPQTLNGHQGSVCCMAISNGTLFSGSYDGTIKVWDLETGKELQTLNGHQSKVCCMAISNGTLFSGSSDKTIKIWDLETGKELQTLHWPEMGELFSIVICDGKLFFSDSLENINVWDLKAEKKLQTRHIRALKNTVIVRNDKCFFISCDSRHYSYHGIKIWDLENEQPLKTFYGHKTWVPNTVIYNGKLFSSSYESIKIWDLTTEQMFQTFERDQKGVTPIAVCDGKLISVLDDLCTIQIRDFNDLPPLPPYSKQVLQKNLTILGKMPWAQYIRRPVEELVEELHPDFKERLRQHCFKLGVAFPNSPDAILRVQTEICLESLLVAIHDEDHDKVSSLFGYFIWIDPKNAEICRLLCKICGKPDSNRWGEYAFHNRPGYPPSLVQKAEAVVQFKQILKKCWGKDFPLFLVDLGIDSEKVCSEKLKCTPDHLSEIGICSIADLKVLGLFKNSFHFDDLKVIPEEPVESPGQSKDMAVIKKRQDRAFNKKEIVSSLLKDLYDAAEQMAKEAEHGALFYETGNIWIAFQKKLEGIRTDLNRKCQTPHEILSTFSQESYAEIVKQMNALINEFQNLNREHQIAILSAYIKRKDTPHNLFRIMGI